MKITRTISHPQLQETVHLAEAENGLQVAIIPTPGFHTTAAHFGLRFGGNDLQFTMPDGTDCQVPTGSAHYLEHKLFEGRTEKVFDRFNRLGANFNGGTSFCTTTYYFSTAHNFNQCLEVLLDFVQYPLINDERVDKERGIIDQEVRMYLDDPGYRATFLLHEAMYESHGIRVGPGGTLEDVARINASHLQKCYDGFYTPQQMRLTIAGDVDVESTLRQLQPLLRDDNPLSAQRVCGDLQSPRTNNWLETEFDVTRPYVFMGFPLTEPCEDGQQRLRQRIINSLVVDLMYDKSSALRQELYDQQLIDDSFGAYWSSEKTWGHMVLTGITDDPHKFVEEVCGRSQAFVKGEFSEHDFERLKKAAWGGIVSAMQTPSAIAQSVLSSMLSENKIFSALDELQKITLGDVQQAAETLLEFQRRAVAVLKPKQK
ncbi:MAG: pitrilysin family protein [Planctomycetota bacterium]|nr:pitrilysin family protein [Planctomycetota bacterium]